jgi:hypothetical protein
MSDATTVLDPATGLSPQDLRQAALTVCSYATDAAEARDLLEALGLFEVLQDSALAS